MVSDLTSNGKLRATDSLVAYKLVMRALINATRGSSGFGRRRSKVSIIHRLTLPETVPGSNNCSLANDFRRYPWRLIKCYAIERSPGRTGIPLTPSLCVAVAVEHIRPQSYWHDTVL